MPEVKTCPDCLGSGKNKTNTDVCGRCLGGGMIPTGR